MGLIQQAGGGTGFSFGRIRPKGDFVKGSMGNASGPVSFMRMYDTTTDVIRQGGKRRGANMGILPVNHPDIFDFIKAKSVNPSMTNFNISVSVTDDFMGRVRRDETLFLVNPHTKEKVRKVKARDLFRNISHFAWKCGDPGIIFVDEINRHNPTPKVGLIESTNPCGELPLLPNESCCLGSINLSKFVKNGSVDWKHLKEVIEISVRFLDDVIDINKYPTQDIEEKTKSNRKIGLGVMGFADMLIKLGIPYDSTESENLAEKIMQFLTRRARKESALLAVSRGSFPNFEGSIWAVKGFKEMRNATVTSIAPTGTTSIIAGCSSGIEPIFAVAYTRNIMDGIQLPEMHADFEKVAKQRSFFRNDLIRRIAEKGSVQGFAEVPQDVRRVFVTALDIAPEWHVRIQAAFQRYCDNAVSKTANLQRGATVEDVERVFTLAYDLKCKGITVYRDGSKKLQVLQTGQRNPQRASKIAGLYGTVCSTTRCMS
jgi:ribonucleoside-diphosphate reductase alpha chain